MTQDQFEDFLESLMVYFNKTGFDKNKKKLRVWYSAVHKIPGEPLNWIQEQIQNDFDGLPTNIPKVIKHYWRMYLEKHPEKRAFENKAHESCPYCHDGLLIFETQEKGYPVPTEKVARCGHCRSDDRTGLGDFLTVNDIERAGGWLIQPIKKINQQKAV